MELGYEDTSTEVYTVDSQVSRGWWGGLVLAAACRRPALLLAGRPRPSAPNAVAPPLLACNLPLPCLPSQYSLGGGVVVQVTGIMQRPGGPKRPFVQTFFLAVQEKGYYVLNDMFRWVGAGDVGVCGWVACGLCGLCAGAGGDPR